MKLLIIYTHPNHESLNGAFLQQVIKGAGENGKIEEVRVTDLYGEGFNPVLVFNKQKRRRDLDKDPELVPYWDNIRWADKIVFIYPIWWGRPPAMLMGFIDRIFVSGFGYRSNGGLLPEGLLKGKSVVCISTMMGPALYLRLWLNNAHKMLMRKALFNYVGMKDVRFFQFGSMESPKGKQQAKLERVYRYFRTVQ
ncbi:NAD(P)H-dependent oxidoreductase [Paenibacillus mesotrionivorans]|uniref:NAD(P)H-dependent oxidoreductase n=1 Tax=Paenibacillus mesotrionivorans TaxID=3160968 RepID=A0ACC7NVN7_9BACL